MEAPRDGNRIPTLLGVSNNDPNTVLPFVIDPATNRVLVDVSGESTFVTTVGFSNADYIADGTDDHVQIQAAMDAVDTAGGGVVFVKNGTYSAAEMVIPNGVSLFFESRKAKVVGKTNAAPNLFISEDFATAATSGNAFSGIAHGFIKGGTFEHGSQTASGGSDYRDMNAVFKLYAWDFEISDIRIDYSPEIGLYTEHDDDWSDDGTFNTYEFGENHYSNIKIKNYGEVGWVNRGSHDSNINNVYLSSSDSSFLDADIGYVQETDTANSFGSNGTIVNNMHVWGNHNTAAVYINNTNIIDGFLYAEGTDGAAIKLNNSSYNRFKAYVGYAATGIELVGSSSNNEITAQVESNLTGALFRIDTSGSSNMLVHEGGTAGGALFDLTNGGTYAGTDNTFIYQNGYSGTAITGTPDGSDMYGMRESKRSVQTLTVSTNAVTPDALYEKHYASHNANITINNPTNGRDGDLILIGIKNTSAGSITVTGDTKFRFGTDITAFSDIAAGKINYYGCRYHATDDKWDVVSEIRGF